MLVLSRKDNETIEFPSLGVVIRVFGLTRKRVQLGIDAPVSLKIIRGEQADDGSTASVSVDSIAEQVIGEEFKKLESQLAALAELADSKDQRLARQVAADLIDRMTRIKRTVTASLRGRDQTLSKELGRSPRDEDRQRPTREELVWHQANRDEPAWVRQTPAGYAIAAT